MQPLQSLEAEYASLRGLTPEDLETLAELLPFTARRASASQPEPSVPSEVVQKCYRARFEAAETRYGRMKALVCASMEEQMRLRAQIRGQAVVAGYAALPEARRAFLLEERTMDECMRREMIKSVWELMEELKRVKEENAKLSEHNQRLRSGVACVGMDLDSPPEPRRPTIALEAELIAARQRISALDMELARLDAKKFDEDEYVRECEDVFDCVLGRVRLEQDSGYHPRFHPMATCSDEACRNYARRLRCGLKQAVAEAYVRERSERIHGHFRFHVEPLERLRLEKDEEIERLQLRLKRLERVSCVTTAEAEGMQLEQVSVQVVLKRSELDTARRELRAVHEECQRLDGERGRLEAGLECLKERLREAEATIDEGKRVRDVIKAERMRMEMESEALGRVRERIDRFMSGDTAIAYDEQRFAFERLEREIEVLKERKAELMAESEESDDDSEEESVVEPPRRGRVRKTDEGAIVILCGDTEVPLDGLEQHAAQFYGASTFCPRGCGYFVPSRRANEMAKHVTTRACAARVQEIERLRK